MLICLLLPVIGELIYNICPYDFIVNIEATVTIATVSSGDIANSNTEFTAALVSVNNPGLTTNLSFIATTDKNGTQVRCVDTIDTNSMTCTIMISGMSLTVSYITNNVLSL